MVKIFVGNLASSTTEEELRSLFTQYGKISECDILKNYGFVHMSSQTEAEEAIRNLHHYELNGEAMNVEMSKRRPKSTTKLHVSNIPEDCSSVDLKAKFEEYGPVVECDIVKDYAFVHMECVDDAMEAISKLDNTAFQGVYASRWTFHFPPSSELRGSSQLRDVPQINKPFMVPTLKCDFVRQLWVESGVHHLPGTCVCQWPADKLSSQLTNQSIFSNIISLFYFFSCYMGVAIWNLISVVIIRCDVETSLLYRLSSRFYHGCHF
ncbi:RNA-binding protein 4.1-like isoform X2 [Osmerus mordax]|uniref:RNA-binding protein 4.1-like isoform X2 n=1 Tax=Osmerus mordax TaxID=8014 RepID=UPI00350FC422